MISCARSCITNNSASSFSSFFRSKVAKRGTESWPATIRSPKKRLSEPEYPGPVALGQPLSSAFARTLAPSAAKKNLSTIVANFFFLTKILDHKDILKKKLGPRRTFKPNPTARRLYLCLAVTNSRRIFTNLNKKRTLFLLYFVKGHVQLQKGWY